ncbi:MAG: ATP-binding protein [Nannocystis sp.]|nr:ATP-binding protein [Nannocystis sp.]
MSITIADNGPGIPQAERERVFEAFYTRKAQGTGLGLAIVQQIVSDHGGPSGSPGADLKAPSLSSPCRLALPWAPPYPRRVPHDVGPRRRRSHVSPLRHLGSSHRLLAARLLRHSQP